MWIKLSGFALMVLFLSSINLAHTQEDRVTERVQFASGSSSATIKGTLKGYVTRDYVLGAQAGQTMRVQMATKSTFLYFNVLPPHSDEALFVGQMQAEPHHWSGTLPADGDYIIRVYLVRAEARRGRKADFVCTVSITKYVTSEEPRQAMGNTLTQLLSLSLIVHSVAAASAEHPELQALCFPIRSAGKKIPSRLSS